jgi:hypothetical protein
MSEFWQYIGVGAALAAAAVYLTVYYVRRRKAKGGCKACRLMQVTQQPQSKPTSSSDTTVN